jgi:ABC-type branched-subunit amino acid transport system ATPase component
MATLAASITGLIGPNGSGKTTLANVIAGIQTANFGVISLDGIPIGHLGPHQRAAHGLARTFQAIRLFDSLTVLENVMLGGHVLFKTGYLSSVLRTPGYRDEWKQKRERAESILRLFGERLLPRAYEPVSTLSYANRRRVEICRALMPSPRLVILDEPTAGMNPYETTELGDQLAELVHEFQFAIILIEHKIDLISRLCSTVYVLDHGASIAVGSPQEVMDNPSVLEAFIGAD